MKPSEYLHIQMELEGIRISTGNLIARASPDVDEFPLMLLASTSDEQKYLYFDSSLSIEVRNRFTRSELQFFNMEHAIEVFHSFGVSSKLGHFRTYRFPDNIGTDVSNVKSFSQDDPEIVAFGFSGLADKVYAIEREGTILSACVSSRQNSQAAEAWVFTHPDHRRKGFAQQVVMAWARSLQCEGVVPFYSHDLANINSANLASKIGLIHLFDESVIEKVA